MYIIGSLANIPNIKKIATFLRKSGKFLVNDGWIAHGPTPDIEYYDYAKSRNWGKSTALTTPIMRSIFALDCCFIEDADIVINIQPSGSSSSVEGGMAFRAKKMTVLLIVDGDETDYRKVEVMFSCYYIIQPISVFMDNGWRELIEKFHKSEHIAYFKRVYDNYSIENVYEDPDLPV